MKPSNLSTKILTAYSGLAEQMEDMRRAHAAAVLSEQSLQKQQHGVCDPEKLAHVSKIRSKWSKTRARKQATGYSKLLGKEKKAV